jgi:hypothetical protein
MKIFTTINDLHNWVDVAMGPDVTPEISGTVTDAIHRDPDAPLFGDDWEEYLANLDLWGLAEAGAIAKD